MNVIRWIFAFVAMASCNALAVSPQSVSNAPVKESSTVGSLGIGAAARAANAVRQTRQAIANDIANGHAFTKHGAEMGFSSPEQMASHIDAVLKNPSAVRQLSRGRTAYWHNPSQSVVIHNPSAINGGTVLTYSRQLKMSKCRFTLINKG
jgi:hypothetical protein